MFYKYLSLFIILSFSFGSANARQSCDWPFRTSITINETSGTTTSNYSVKLTLTGSTGGTLSSAYNWSNNGADLRFFDSNDSTALSFSIASWDQANKIAEVWVTLPTFTRNSSRSIYVYYGNSNATAIGNSPPTTTYVDGKIKFHTRYNNDQINDPDNLAEAKALFDSQDDTNTAYGCTHPDSYAGIRNSTQNTPNGAIIDFIAYSTTLFTVPSTGIWGVRYGADYGLGGGLYIDGIALDERWDEDLWWGGSSWNNADVLSGTRNLSAGEHKLEIIGAEGGDDGGLTIQFRSPDGTWSQDPGALGIDIRSEACPMVRHTIQYGSHDICELDLSLHTPTAINSEWFVGSSNEVILQVDFESSTPSGLEALPTTKLVVELPTDVSLTGSLYSGINWTCSGISGLITCDYSQTLSSSQTQSDILTLYTKVDATASANDIINLTAIVSTPQVETQLLNNTLSQDITLRALTGLDPSCSSPKPGIWARYFETGASGIVIDDASEFQALVNSRMNESYLYGQTILSNINGSGNPFDAATNPNNFMVILQGYIYIPSTGRYYFSVDGDDAVEAWIDDSIISTYYGAHGTKGSPVDKNRINNLSEGFHKVEFRLQEDGGRDAYDFYWSTARNGGDTIIPSSAYYHCAGSPNIEITTAINVESDDINGTSLAKAIPNSIVKYTVTGTNKGNISTDYGSTIITQKIDDNNELFVKDLNGAGEGPIHFIDGSSTDASGLSYTYNAIDGLSDNLWFSTDGSTYTESTNLTNDYNAAITHFQIRFDGSLKASIDTAEPRFIFEYQVRVK